MSTLVSSNAAALEILLSPSPNFRDIPTITICNHEIPLPAYWRITELLTSGKEPDSVIALVLQYSGVRTREVVEEIVHNIADNQKTMEKPTKSKRVSKDRVKINEDEKGKNAGNRISLFLGKKSKKDRNTTMFPTTIGSIEYGAQSTKTALQLQKERERNAAAATEARLHKADVQERELLTAAMNLASKRDTLLKEQRMGQGNPVDAARMRAMSEIDADMQKTLQRHAEIEMEKEFIRRMNHLMGASDEIGRKGSV